MGRFAGSLDSYATYSYYWRLIISRLISFSLMNPIPVATTSGLNKNLQLESENALKRRNKQESLDAVSTTTDNSLMKKWRIKEEGEDVQT